MSSIPEHPFAPSDTNVDLDAIATAAEALANDSAAEERAAEEAAEAQATSVRSKTKSSAWALGDTEKKVEARF